MKNSAHFRYLLIVLLFISLLAGACSRQEPQTGSSGTTQNTDSADSPDSTDSASGAGDDSDHSTECATRSEDASSMAPDFTVLDGEGNRVSLSDFLGKPVIVNFWATWCGPCKNEMPEFEEVYAEYGEQIHFLMINCTDGTRDTVESVRDFIKENGYTFPVYYDTESSAAVTYGVSGIPMTFFIDAEGHAVAYAQGSLDRETLLKGIDMIYTP